MTEKFFNAIFVLTELFAWKRFCWNLLSGENAYNRALHLYQEINKKLRYPSIIGIRNGGCKTRYSKQAYPNLTSRFDMFGSSPPLKMDNWPVGEPTQSSNSPSLSTSPKQIVLDVTLPITLTRKKNNKISFKDDGIFWMHYSTRLVLK